MGTKMKGLLKGLRYITQIFDEEKEPEMLIGNPTDVKHVAHIGWDGPSVDPPTWMEEFKSPQGSETAPSSSVNGESKEKENPETKRVSEGSTRRGSRSKNTSTKDLPDLPKSSRHNSLEDGSSTITALSPRRESSTKSRQSRRNTSNGPKQPKGLVIGSDSPSKTLPDIPKRSSRKKSNDPTSGGSTRSSRSKAHIPPPIAYTSPFSDPGPNTEFISGSGNTELTRTISSRPLVREREKECNGIC